MPEHRVNEIAGSHGPIAAVGIDAALREVLLGPVHGRPYRGIVGLSDPLVTEHERHDRHRFRRGEGKVRPDRPFARFANLGPIGQPSIEDRLERAPVDTVHWRLFGPVFIALDSFRVPFLSAVYPRFGLVTSPTTRLASHATGEVRREYAARS